MAGQLRRFFFFNDTATTEIYTLSLHDALPISCGTPSGGPTWTQACARAAPEPTMMSPARRAADRKSTRLNSSHQIISYAVFCLKKKRRGLDRRDCSQRRGHYAAGEDSRPCHQL